MDRAAEIKALRYSYGNGDVLNGIDLNVERGEVIGILGENGSGKSTLLKITAGILRNYRGSVRVFNEEVCRTANKRLARMIAYLPQFFAPTFDLRVRTIVTFGRNPFVGFMKGLTGNDVEIVDRSMKAANVIKLSERLYSTLSGGERQRTVIAKALAQEGKVLLMDEFSAHLDPGHSQKVTKIALELAREKKLSVIAAFHDVNQAISMSDRLLFLKEGNVIALGCPEEVVNESLMKEVYDADTCILENPVNKKPLVIFS